MGAYISSDMATKLYGRFWYCGTTFTSDPDCKSYQCFHWIADITPSGLLLQRGYVHDNLTLDERAKVLHKVGGLCGKLSDKEIAEHEEQAKLCFYSFTKE